MSLFGALDTAISGLTAQAGAFGNISDNVANSQTVGFKRIDSSFIDYLTTSTQQINDSGAVAEQPSYVNTVQGTVTQTDNKLALAVNGQGFFAASQTDGQVNGLPTFNPQTYYTRAGDFQQSKDGYLVNSAGLTLQGWAVNPATGIVNRNVLAPIQINQSAYQPQQTTSVTLAANLPATPAANTPISSPIQVYDTLGTAHTVNLNWTQVSPNTWTVTANSPDDASGTADRGGASVRFGGTLSDGTTAPDGTPGKVAIDGTDPGSVSIDPATGGANTAATFSFTTNFGNGPQTIGVNLGAFGQATGTTQYAGTQYALHGLTQNGVPQGAYSGVTLQSTGDVVVNYDNGQSRTIAQVPVITFNAPDALQRQNGQAFTATTASGTPLAEQAGVNGAGALVTSSTESSNVDIASELSKLIVAQNAYTANAKLVTSADQLLLTTINMKQ